MSQSGPTVLLIASNVPPAGGGSSAVVCDNLARHAPDDILVLRPRRNYFDGLPMIGWREQDRRAPFRTQRLDLLRTPMRFETEVGASGPTAWQEMQFRLGDLCIKARLLRTVLMLVRRGNLRTVCVDGLASCGWLLILLRRVVQLGLPLQLVALVHGDELAMQNPFDPNRHRYRAALLAADRIVTANRFTHSAIHALLGPDAGSRLCVIRNGVDSQRFRPGPKRPDLLDRYGLRGRFVFVSVCQMLEKKGLDQAIRAIARLLPTAPDITYLLVGAGPFEPELRRIARQEGVADRVVLAGHVTDNDLVAHYRLGDVFVMPNRQTSTGDTTVFGLAFLEANACGLPVIAGRDGGGREAIHDEENGLVVDGRSVRAIEEAMRRLYEDAALRHAITANGLRAAAARGWEKPSRQFLALCGLSRPSDAA